jgi:hypothetical protein
MIPRLGYVAMRSLPVPFRLLKLAEFFGNQDNLYSNLLINRITLNLR